MMTFEKFTKEHWQPGPLLALKPSSVRIYQFFNLDKYVLPTLGSLRLCEVDRATIEHLLLALSTQARRYTAFGSRLQGVLHTAVESGYLERNTAHGIQIGGREPKKPCTVPDPQFPRSVQSPSAVRVESPAKHEQAAGGNPTSRDANDDQSPLPVKGYDERREARNDDDDGDS